MPFTFNLSMRLALMKSVAAVAASGPTLSDGAVVHVVPSSLTVILDSERKRQFLAFDRTRLARVRAQGGSV